MSTKQAVVFAFMLVFLLTTVVAMALWFHFSLELDVKERTIAALQKRQRELDDQKNKLNAQIKGAVNAPGLESRLQLAQTGTTEHIARYLADGAESRIKLYEEQGKEIQQKWGQTGEAAKQWQSVYEDWRRENTTIAESRGKLVDMEKNSLQQVETSRKELADQREEEERKKRETVQKRKSSAEEMAKIRNLSEETQERVNEVTRELEKVEGDDRDGEVIYGAKNTVTVDLGYDHGAKAGLEFTVFSGRHAIPVRKGKIRLTDVRATSSDALILEEIPVKMVDPITGWVAPDPQMRYSIYATGGQEKGIAPQPLERYKSKREQIREQRAAQKKQEEEASEGKELPVTTADAAEEPQIMLGKGLEPITNGDWISNTEFHRIIPARQFQKVLTSEMLAMQDISLNPQTFYFSPLVKSYRMDYLRRLCERNQCKTAPQMSAEVEYVVTSPDTTRLELVKERLGNIKEEALANETDLTPDRLALVRTYKALLLAQKYGAKAISETQLEKYFLDRGRKKEMLKGEVKQPGQSVFFVVGETKIRSVRETGLFIKDHGGIMAPAMDEKVDYLVVGEGMNDAKWDKATRRIYYAGQPTPDTAMPFADAVKYLGLRLLREDELPQFFGR